MSRSETSPESRPGQTAGRTAALAVAAGVSVAGIYYNQPVLGLLGAQFGADARALSSIPVLTQIGYAAGLLLLLPLGDRLERRSLILAMMAALALTLAGSTLAPSLRWLAGLSFLVGVFASVTQQLVPLSVLLTAPERRGHAVGTVTGGILAGILLARTLSGAVSERFGWPAMYLGAAAAVLAVAGGLALGLPRVAPATRTSYPRLLGSLWRLLHSYPVLRQAALVQALLFGAYMAVWADLALVLQDDYRLGSTIAGLFGLAGLSGALAAPLAGRLVNRLGPNRLAAGGALLAVTSFLLMGLTRGSLPALGLAMALLDLGVWVAQVANLCRVYALDAKAQSRLNTVLMTSMFAGGALGSALGGTAYARGGWPAVCLSGALAAGAAALVALTGTRRRGAG
ncbi:MAG: MFS transporter [Rhodospirillaceae bacterium]